MRFCRCQSSVTCLYERAGDVASRNHKYSSKIEEEVTKRCASNYYARNAFLFPLCVGRTSIDDELLSRSDHGALEQLM